ncbi:L-threonylcarbamoyladenylate synthase [Pseudomonas zhanjiangensis]|uniref:Threonylcarbamoyl-AMP synthase n=1 Tax=Pseudomonas zhanjiangensis TaxID=3239015 RepID=A0ABV3YZ60_9PSED
MPQLTSDLDLACARLRAGHLLALPTETVYGLAADARNAEAVARVFALKGRPSSNPLIVHLANADQAEDWATAIGPAARRLMARFWPGPLTLVLPARDQVPRSITAGQDSVALRVPAHPVARQLLERFAGALVAPSANRYMSISPTSSAHVVQQFADSDLLILEGGECRVGLESTIVSLLPGEPPRLLREGMLAAGAIEQVLGEPLLRGGEGAVRAPGQHHRHYAPGTPSWRFREAPPAALADPRCGWIWCGGARASAGPAIDLGEDPVDFAQGLYAALYRLDNLGLERMMIRTPPDDAAWAAIHDRLSRASAMLD